jgi:hypothetical protein
MPRGIFRKEGLNHLFGKISSIFNLLGFLRKKTQVSSPSKVFGLTTKWLKQS